MAVEIGQQIMEYIISAGLVEVQDVEDSDDHIIVWSANAAEQMTALVNDWRMHDAGT